MDLLFSNISWQGRQLHIVKGSSMCPIYFSGFANQIVVISTKKSKASSGPWFNIKMTSYRHRKSHCGDKTILRLSYLHNGISYTGKTTSLYWIRAQVFNICRISGSFYRRFMSSYLKAVANHVDIHADIEMRIWYIYDDIYIIISKNIRYLLWNRGAWRSLNNTHLTFLDPCIRCTNNLCDSCDITDVNPHFIPSLLRKIQNVDLLWRHRYRSRPPAIVTSQWPIVPVWLLWTVI